MTRPIDTPGAKKIELFKARTGEWYARVEWATWEGDRRVPVVRWTCTEANDWKATMAASTILSGEWEGIERSPVAK